MCECTTISWVSPVPGLKLVALPNCSSQVVEGEASGQLWRLWSPKVFIGYKLLRLALPCRPPWKHPGHVLKHTTALFAKPAITGAACPVPAVGACFELWATESPPGPSYVIYNRLHPKCCPARSTQAILELTHPLPPSPYPVTTGSLMHGPCYAAERLFALSCCTQVGALAWRVWEHDPPNFNFTAPRV